MNFYQQNKHLFDDDNQTNTGPVTRISQLDQFLTKPRPVPNFPKLTYYEKEPLQLQPQPQSEAPKNVFSQNARNLLGNNYNDKYEALYDRNSYTGRKEFENRHYDLPGSYNQPNSADNNMKNFISPLKASYNQSAGSKVDSLTNLDRYNVPSSYDQNQNIGSASFSKQGTREQYSQENRQIDNSYGYGAKSFGRNIPNDPYKRIEGLPPLPENRGGNINNPDRYAQNKPNYGVQQQQQQQDRVPAWQNDNIRNNPVRSNISQQGPESRNYLGDDSSRKENRYTQPQPQYQIQQNVSERPPQGRVSHNESGGYSATRIKESQSMKITSKEVANEEIKRDWRFPHDDYQAIKRKVGIRDLDTSDVSALQNVRPHMQASWQNRLSELNAIKGRRTLPEALERRSLNATNPERKNRLKALLRGE